MDDGHPQRPRAVQSATHPRNQASAKQLRTGRAHVSVPHVDDHHTDFGAINRFRLNRDLVGLRITPLQGEFKWA
jgi:hypothetical protein